MPLLVRHPSRKLVNRQLKAAGGLAGRRLGLALLADGGGAPGARPVPPRRLTGRDGGDPAAGLRRRRAERMFGRLKDFRRIATRHDRSATNFMAAVHIVATVTYWL